MTKLLLRNVNERTHNLSMMFFPLEMAGKSQSRLFSSMPWGKKAKLFRGVPLQAGGAAGFSPGERLNWGRGNAWGRLRTVHQSLTGENGPPRDPGIQCRTPPPPTCGWCKIKLGILSGIDIEILTCVSFSLLSWDLWISSQIRGEVKEIVEGNSSLLVDIVTPYHRGRWASGRKE